MRIRFAVAPGIAWDDAAGFGAFVDALETLRFDTVWLSDVPLASTLDPLLGLTYAASRTTRLKLGANVVPLGRNLFRFTKELAQIDRLSGGRLLLSFVPGIGAPGERATLGLGDANRGAYLETIIPLVRRWWAGETVEHHGDGFDIPPITLDPLPVQQPLEIWLGGRGPLALARVGKFADGWLGGLTTPHDAGRARAAIEHAAADAHREIDADHFGVGITYGRTAPDPDLIRGVQARLPPGTDVAAVLPVGRDALRRLIGDYVGEGMSKFVIRGLAGPGAWDDELAWLADAVFDLQT